MTLDLDEFKYIIESMEKKRIDGFFLNEDMFNTPVNKSELDKIDSLFQEIMDAHEFNIKMRGYIAPRNIVVKNFREIIKILEKVFNLKIDMDLIKVSPTDVNGVYHLTSIASTIINTDALLEMSKKLNSIIIDQKKGYHYIKPTSLYMSFEMAFIRHAVRLNKEDAPLPFKIDGSHMTAILLHEIGHNFLIKADLEDRSETKDWAKENIQDITVKIQAPGSPIKEYNISKRYIDLWKNERNARIGKGILYSFYGLTLSLFTVIPIPLLYTVNRTRKRILSIKDERSHNFRELNADKFPVVYGYGKKLSDAHVIMSFMFNTKYYRPKGIKNKIKRAFSYLFSTGGNIHGEVFLSQTEEIASHLDFESNNKNNPAKAREILKQQAKEVRENAKFLLEMSE